MTGRERVLATLRGEPPQATPVAAFYAMESGVELAGFTRRDIRTDPAKYVQTCALMQEVIHSDIILAGGEDLMVIAEAAPGLGLSQQEVMERNRNAKPLLDSKADLDKFSARNLDENKGRFGYYTEICRGLKEGISDALPVASVYAPWTTATMLRGIENLIYDTIDDPDFVARILRCCTDICQTVAGAVVRAGAAAFIGDPAAGCTLISPDMFRRWARPYLAEALEATRGIRILHICGSTDPIIEDLASLGAGAISIDNMTSLSKAMEAARGRVAVMGNIATDLYVAGTAEQMESAIRDCFQAARGKGRFILASGCQIPWNATIESIKSFMEIGRSYAALERTRQ